MVTQRAIPVYSDIKSAERPLQCGVCVCAPCSVCACLAWCHLSGAAGKHAAQPIQQPIQHQHAGKGTAYPWQPSAGANPLGIQWEGVRWCESNACARQGTLPWVLVKSNGKELSNPWQGTLPWGLVKSNGKGLSNPMGRSKVVTQRAIPTANQRTVTL